MIKAYLVGITTYYEGEDIEIKINIFKDEESLLKQSYFKQYRKPAVVEHVALLDTLKRLEQYKGEKITIVINNPSLYEQIRGTSTLKNEEALKMTKEINKQLKEFENSITIKDVSNDKDGLKQWKEVLGS
ncbi:reverse transcriptase-like protein [Tepidibacter hydrothermalis]|uniref:Reverse transcriptase-like protein n=1 Tax=Tepidibacter hydrothermalis TaxID=3036126 RepID=A0ABY8E9N0_9FIRM|nr:reverse transcriptase-like protein [Tepidibacter hydrothermalis]WFD09636.1 reverse transcriptase-like protein [Tepidibacter hydrothermalis]